jgi:hypothetical protein
MNKSSRGLEIITEKDKKSYASSVLIPLFGNVKNAAEPLTVPNTTKEAADFLLQFAEILIKKDKEDQKKYANPSQWEEDCVEKKWFDANITIIETPKIIKIINLANTLGFESLNNMCCYSIAQRIKGKTTQEMRDELGIINDLTEEEEAEINKENSWWI